MFRFPHPSSNLPAEKLQNSYKNRCRQDGEIVVTGLDADTEYEIIGKYIYKNEEDKKIENTFVKGKVKTKGYEALGIIELAKEEGRKSKLRMRYFFQI